MQHNALMGRSALRKCFVRSEGLQKNLCLLSIAYTPVLICMLPSRRKGSCREAGSQLGARRARARRRWEGSEVLGP